MAEKKIPYTPPDFPEIKLSDQATRTRRNLIAAMAVWTLIVPFGLHPKKIVLFDIDLDTAGISVTTLISFALVYFWASFMIYAYKDWLGWWHQCRSLIDEKSDLVNRIQVEISEISKAVNEALEEGKSGNQQVTVLHSINSNLSTSNGPLSGWKKRVGENQQLLQMNLKLLQQLRTDIYLRSLWDYWLPTAIILGPLWYFLR